MLGVNLVKREPIYYTTPEDKALLTYYAVYCVACGNVIGRLPFAATDRDKATRVKVFRAAHFRECSEAPRGEWVPDGMGHWVRKARRSERGQSSVVGMVEQRGVAWRWMVRAGVGLKRQDSGYKDTQGQAMAAADECMATIMRRGK